MLTILQCISLLTSLGWSGVVMNKFVSWGWGGRDGLGWSGWSGVDCLGPKESQLESIKFQSAFGRNILF